MTAPRPAVVRGGREIERAAKQFADDQKRLEEQQRQMEADLRFLTPLPQFRRMLVQWITESQVFAVPLGLPHDQMREWSGRADMGRRLWNAVTAIDPTFAVEVLANRPSTPPKDD